MRSAHTVEQVRAAEMELMARLPEGALMQRAAAGLAYAVIDLLGGGYGRRWWGAQWHPGFFTIAWTARRDGPVPDRGYGKRDSEGSAG